MNDQWLYIVCEERKGSAFLCMLKNNEAKSGLIQIRIVNPVSDYYEPSNANSLI